MADGRVFVAACDDYAGAEAAVRRALDAFGGAAGILGDAKTVMVKPNLVMPRKPDGAATTHPAVVGAVCSAFIEAGVRVSVIDSTAMLHTPLFLKRLYSSTGMEEMAGNTGAELSLDTSSRRLPNPGGRLVKEFEVMFPVAAADIVISAGKAKTHGFTGLTGCAKNLFGVVPGSGKPLMHKRFPLREDFAAMLADLVELISPRFCVLDAVVGMEGPGPTGGRPKKLGAVICGINPFAVDLAQARLMRFPPKNVPLLAEAMSRGLIPESPDELEWLGDDPRPLETPFIPAAPSKNGGVSFLLSHLLPKRAAARLRAARAPFPVITEDCAGCGDCARVCPQGAIAIEGKRAAVDVKKCIKCYCCHEFCPVRAIGFTR